MAMRRSGSFAGSVVRRRIQAHALAAVAVGAACGCLALTGLAAAQTRGAGASASTHPARATKPKAAIDAGNGAAPPASAESADVEATRDAGVVEAKTLDGGTRVFKFSELDIEGRLKSPELVYFLRRVRAEFAAGDLGHRPFLREMSESRKAPCF